jgi:uncharacterized protein (DUF1501 family)
MRTDDPSFPVFGADHHDHGPADELIASAAHELTHRGALSRRRLLQIAALAAAGEVAAIRFGPLQKALGLSLTVAPADQILVLVTLAGGNDGLNTTIPIDQYARYRSLRPNVGFDQSVLLPIAPDTALNPYLPKLQARYQTGKVAVIRNVGYADPNLSHFSSTDFWMRGSAGNLPTVNTAVTTGWLGRWHDQTQTGNPNPFTMIGLGGLPFTLRSNAATQPGLALPYFKQPKVGLQPSNPLNDHLATAFAGMDATPLGTYGTRVANLNRKATKAAGLLSSSYAPYAGPNNSLAQQLFLAANVINAGLNPKVFTVQLDPFDNHQTQVYDHQTLMEKLDYAIESFFTRLGPTQKRKVIMVTWSEFGRRPKENGNGTDHGTASTMFAIGEPVIGGLYGPQFDLAAGSLDANGDLKHSIDFRQVYASVIQGVFGAYAPRVLGGPFAPIRFLPSL